MAHPIEIPLSPWCALLVLAAPGWAVLARAAAAACFREPGIARILAPALGVAGWLAALHLVSYASGSFALGLTAGTALPGLAGSALWLWRRRRGAPAEATADSTEAADAERRDARRMLLSAAAATLVIAPLAFGWAFHDEVYISGHHAIAAQIQNGHYPPRNLSFAEVELRYHYGFNTVSAAVGSILRVPLPTAMDLVTCAGWFYCWCLLWTLGRRITGSRFGAWAAPLVLFAGGLPVLCDLPVENCPACPSVSLCPVDGWAINPPVVSYFFQHPWTLGLPLALAALLAWDARGERPGLRHAALLGGLLLALAWSQLVLFLCTLGALWGAELLAAGPGRARRAAAATALVLVVVGVASLSGGWFARGGGGLGLELAPGVTGSLSGTLRWLAASHGALLVVGAAGMFALRRLRVALALLVVGSLAALNLANYVHTWDIVKFATVAQVALGLAAAAVVARWLEAGRERWRPLAAGAVLIACAGAGANFVVALPATSEEQFARRFETLGADDADAVSWLRPRIAAGEVVVRMDHDAALGYAQWGGLPQIWMDGVLSRVLALGASPERIGRRQRLLMTWPDALAPWRAEGVRWLVIAPGDLRLAASAARWAARGEAREAGRFGALRVVELGD